MIHDSYKTISKPSEGLYKDKGSKFLAFAIPIRSEEQVKEKNKSAQKKIL
jgi:putative IMPACT (imprinted ancient) family translation regulator